MLADVLQMTEETLKLRASQNRVTVGLRAGLWGGDEPVALDSGPAGLFSLVQRALCLDTSPERAANDSGSGKNEFWEIWASKCPGLCPRS